MATESRTKNSLRNIRFGIINKLVIMALAFVNRRLFIDFIGIDYLGINSLFTEILGVLSLADLGFGTAMAYSFYRPIAEKDDNKIAALITFYSRVYNIIAASVAIIGLALVPFLRYIVHTDRVIDHLEIYYVVFLANTVVSYLFAYKSSIITASQKQYMVSQYQVYINLLKTVLQIAVLITLHNYLVYICVSVVTTLLNNLLISRKATQLYPAIKKKLTLPKAEKKDIFSNLKSVFLYKVASTLLNSTDNTLISVMCGTVFVGYYGNYKTITSNLNAFIIIIFGSLTASIGNLIVTSASNHRYRVFKCMQLVSFVLAMFSVAGICVLANDFITIWLHTDEYLVDNFTLFAIMTNYYFAVALQPLWSYREATGLYRKTRYIMVLAAVINLVLSILLGKIWGMGGILFASVIAKVSTYVWYEPKLLFRDYFKEKVSRYYLPLIENFLLAAACVVASVLCTSFIKEVTVITFFIKSVITFSIITMICLLRYARTDEAKIILSKFIRR